MRPAPETLLLGTISLDHYDASRDILPGGGALNMAWHWRELGRPFHLLTRVGDLDGDAILEFIDRHTIPCSRGSIVEPGRSSAIDIGILADRQPNMHDFVPGVWDAFRLTPGEVALVRRARRLHAVLIEGAIAELERLGEAGTLTGVAVSADFLGFRHYTVERLARTMRHVDLGFVGWPGGEDDAELSRMAQVAFDLRRVLVVTMGARAVRIFDGRAEPRADRFEVSAVPVAGTTLGCGDAFIAWFLDELWRSDDLRRAAERGKLGGALATRWMRPLPDTAYAASAAPTAIPIPGP